MRYLILVLLLACTPPAEPPALGPLNARLSYTPGVLTYSLDHAAPCKITAYFWETGYWAGRWDLPKSRSGRVQVGRLLVDTYFHLQCTPVVTGDETWWATLLAYHSR